LILHLEMFTLLYVFLYLCFPDAFKNEELSNRKSKPNTETTSKQRERVRFQDTTNSVLTKSSSIAYKSTGLSPHKLPDYYDVKNDPNYVKRSCLENQIQSVSDNRDHLGEYYIVYGVEGAGKSYLIASVLEGKDGVIRIDVSRGDTLQLQACVDIW
jgi:hypothetical protein